MRHLTAALRATPTSKFAVPVVTLLSTYLLIDPFSDDKSVTVALGYFIAVGLAFYYCAEPMRPIIGGLITDIRQMMAGSRS